VVGSPQVNPRVRREHAELVTGAVAKCRCDRSPLEVAFATAAFAHLPGHRVGVVTRLEPDVQSVWLWPGYVQPEQRFRWP